MYNSGVEKLVKRGAQIESAQLSNGQTMRYNNINNWTPHFVFHFLYYS